MSAHHDDHTINPKDLPVSQQESHRQRVVEVRARLAQEFSIDTIYIGVPKLSRILGIAPSTIYGYMRRGQFFMPYRMINTTAMIALDDIAEWHCSSDGVVPPAALPPAAPPEKSEPDKAPAKRTAPPAPCAANESVASARDLVEQTRRGMGLPLSRTSR